MLAGEEVLSWDAAPIAVVGVVPVRNAAESPTRFELDPQGMLDAERTITGAGGVVIGVVHSHPSSPAVPSATDRADAMTYDPQATFVQLIVSMQGFVPTIRAWRIAGTSDAEVDELTITVETT